MSGPFANMKNAIDGTVGESNGQKLKLKSSIHLGVPQGQIAFDIITSLKGQLPFIFGFNAHAYVYYGITWMQRFDETGPVQITRLELIDPYPTSPRLTWIAFPANMLILQRIHGLLMLEVSRG